MKKKKRKLRYSRIIIALILIFIIIKSLLYFTNNFSNIFSTPQIPELEVAEVPQDITISLTAIGDIMCHSPNFKAVYNSSTKSYDFTPFFTEISEYTKNADITIGNLETTFAGEARGYSGYPTFNSPSALGLAIKDIGVDVLCTANNHSLDKGFSGLSSTLDTLDEMGISHMGTYRNEEEQNSILVKNVNGINIAFLAFTYGTNGIAVPKDKSFCINLINKDLILKQINSAKEKNVDIICVNMHWGIEYQTSPNSEQKELANFLFENGVDIILGSHPHVLQQMEKREIELPDSTSKDGFVIYSLGNFCSAQKDVGTKDSIILNLQITKHGDNQNISIDKVDFVPIYCNDKGNNVKNRYQLIDLKKSISDFETKNEKNATYNTYKTALQRIEKIIHIDN